MDNPATTRRVVVLILAMLLVGVVGWGLWHPEGETRTRLRITEGPVHGEPAAWRTRAVRWLPAVVHRALKLQDPIVLQREEPTVWVWSARLPLELMEGSVPGRLEVWMKDTSGFENRVRGIMRVQGDRGETTLGTVWCRTVPRRVERHQVRIAVEGGTVGTVEELEASRLNRWHGRVYPEWVPERFPVQRVAEGTDVAVDSAWVSAGAEGKPPRLRMGIRLRGRSDGSAGWGFGPVRVKDVTGNQAQGDYLGMERVGEGLYEAEWDWPLWSDEPAWDLRVEMKPLVAGVLRASEQEELGPVRVPAKDEVVTGGWESLMDLGSVRILGLVGEHATLPGRERDVQGMATLELERGMNWGEVRLEVMGVRDEAGRGARLTCFTGTTLSWGVHVLEESKEVWIQLALYRPRVLEMRIRPEFR